MTDQPETKPSLTELRALEKQQREALQDTSRLIKKLTETPDGWEVTDDVVIRAGCTTLRGAHTEYGPHGDPEEYHINVVIDKSGGMALSWGYDHDHRTPFFLPREVIESAFKTSDIMEQLKVEARERLQSSRRRTRAIPRVDGED